MNKTKDQAGGVESLTQEGEKMDFIPSSSNGGTTATEKRLKEASSSEMDVEGEGSKVRKDHPLEIEVVLQELFKCLDTENLMKCSMVNKKWNAKARTFIRNHRVCTAVIGRNNLACEDLKDFEQVLRTMKTVPYNHVKLHSPWKKGNAARHTCGAADDECLNSRLQSIFNVEWKGVTVLEQDKNRTGLCDAVKVVNEIITKQCRTIQEVRRMDVPNLRGLPGFFFFLDLQFPQLKVFQLGHHFLQFVVPLIQRRAIHPQISILQEFFARIPLMLPNLHTFDTVVTPADVYLLSKPDLDLKFITKFELSEPSELKGSATYRRLLEGNLAIVDLTAYWGDLYCGIEYFSENGVGQGGLWGRFVRFIECCAAKTLEKLHTSFVVAAVATRAGLPVFPKVQQLRLNLENECFWPGSSAEAPPNLAATILSVFLRRVVPNVERIYLYANYNSLGGQFWHWAQRTEAQQYFERQLQMLTKEDTNSADQVSDKPLELVLYFDYITDLFGILSLRRLSKLHVAAPFDKSSLLCLAPIYKFWPDLQELTLQEVSPECAPPIPNVGYITLLDELGLRDLVSDNELFTLDAVLCGISAQEALELQKLDDDALRKVNIVPLMPSITSFKKLRQLHLKLEDSGSGMWKEEWLSKVSGLQVFRRCPQLKVSMSGPNNLKTSYKRVFGASASFC